METSTWQAATSRDDDVQSESEKYWVRPRTISVEAPVAGSVKIRGFCDAVEGTLLQVGVNDRWPESAFRLVGTRSSEDEGSKIAWEYEHSEPL